jgi:hypothetical protein
MVTDEHFTRLLDQVAQLTTIIESMSARLTACELSIVRDDPRPVIDHVLSREPSARKQVHQGVGGNPSS